MHGHKVLLHHILHLHQSEDGLVLMMRQQLSLLCQTHGVDTMRLEHDNGEIGTDRDNHQRQEKVVSSRQLGYEEHACQRSVHDTAHDPRHSHQGKILLGQISRHLYFIAEM